ncbi:MAG: 23S rRNA (adenine(2503)-C(2))-methyltransferase RlmN [Acidobacteriota bacterium]
MGQGQDVTERAPDAAHDPRVDVLSLGRRDLATALENFVDRPFRVKQIYKALHERGLADFDSMTDLSQALRSTLHENFRIENPEIAERHEASDGTTKYLFRLDDGATIEAVDIPDGKRRTVCVSSQAGCALACQFCVTGFWGAGRNLTAGEILAQVRAVEAVPRPETHGLNLVFMGMGEPFLNLENLKTALMILLERISWRRITVSTAGVVPGVEAMAGWERRPQLAISLHAPDEERRNQLMPINMRYPLADLIPALRAFPLNKGEHITFEYLMLDGFNDSLDDADLLVRLLSGLSAKMNLIPLNPDPVLDPRLKPSRPEQVTAFVDRLRGRGLMTTVRKQRGDDVSAACGQLRAPDRTPRGFRRSRLSF